MREVNVMYSVLIILVLVMGQYLIGEFRSKGFKEELLGKLNSENPWEKHEEILERCKKKQRDLAETDPEQAEYLGRILKQLEPKMPQRNCRVFLCSAPEAILTFYKRLGLTRPEIMDADEFTEAEKAELIRLTDRLADEEMYYSLIYHQNFGRYYKNRTLF